MIVHLTHGATRILLHIQDAAESQPQINLLPEKSEPDPVPAARFGSGLSRPLTIAAVGLFCAFLGYRFAPNRSDHDLAAPALAKVASSPSYGPSARETAQMPAPLQRELASRPVVTPTAPASTGASRGDGSPFGLD